MSKLRIRISLRTIFLSYVIVSVVGIVLLSLYCKNDAEDHSNHNHPYLMEILNQDHQNKETNLADREKQLHSKEQMLHRLATNLKRLYPDAADHIAEALDDGQPVIYAITPTYTRPVQKAELIRLSQTFLHLTNFHWIVVEDAEDKTHLVGNLLEDSGLSYTHLNIKTPKQYQLGEKEPSWKKPRGVEQRNIAINWLVDNTNKDERPTGVVYFADDDNTYSLKIFEEMRSTQTVSVWPVGLVGGMRFERPIINEDGNQVTGWYAGWKPDRPFAMDMAGFAVNLRLFHDRPDVRFQLKAPGGYLETSLLDNLVTLEELEPKAEACTKVYVWHTRTEKPKWREEDQLIKLGKPSDPNVEV